MMHKRELDCIVKSPEVQNLFIQSFLALFLCVLCLPQETVDWYGVTFWLNQLLLSRLHSAWLQKHMQIRCPSARKHFSHHKWMMNLSKAGHAREPTDCVWKKNQQLLFP